MEEIFLSSDSRCSVTQHFTHTELMSSVKSFANCVNIIRGNTSHLVRKNFVNIKVECILL